MDTLSASKVCEKYLGEIGISFSQATLLLLVFLPSRYDEKCRLVITININIVSTITATKTTCSCTTCVVNLKN